MKHDEDYMEANLPESVSGNINTTLDTFNFAIGYAEHMAAPLLAHIERLQAQLDKHKDKYAPYSGEWAGTREGL